LPLPEIEPPFCSHSHHSPVTVNYSIPAPHERLFLQL